MSIYSPKNHAAHVSARRKHIAEQKQAKAAKELAFIAAQYAANPKSLDARFGLCNAIIALIDDGDAWADRADYLYDQRRDAQMTAEWERAA